MRVWRPTQPPKDIDPRIFNILKRLNEGASQTQVAVQYIDRTITNLGVNPDLTNYFYLPGRAGGQVGLGASLTSDGGSIARLTLQAYNKFTGSVSARSSRLEMSNDIALRCDSLYIVERDLTYAGIDGFQFLTGAGFGSQFNVFGGSIRLLANTPGGSPQLVIDNTGTGGSAAAKLFTIKAKSTQTGDLTEWLNSAGAVMSRIKFDGTFEGPISATGFTVVLDSTFRVVDNVDPLKQLGFEVAGVTSGQTSILTVPDADGTIALLNLAQTWTATQTFQPTTGNAIQTIDGASNLLSYIRGSDGAFVGPIVLPTASGSLLLETGDNFSLEDGSGILLLEDLTFTGLHSELTGLTADDHPQYMKLTGRAPFDTISAQTGQGTVLRITNDFSGDYGAVGEPRGLDIALSDSFSGDALGAGWTGINLFALPNAGGGWASGSTIGEIIGLTAFMAPATTIPITLGAMKGLFFGGGTTLGDGSTIAEQYGIQTRIFIDSSTHTPSGVTNPILAGLLLEVGTRATSTLMAGVRLINPSAAATGDGIVTAVAAFDIDSTFGAYTGVTTWSGLRIPAISGPGTIWGLDITGTMNNRVAGAMTIGSTTAPRSADASLDLYGSILLEGDSAYKFRNWGDTANLNAVTRNSSNDLTFGDTSDSLFFTAGSTVMMRVRSVGVRIGSAALPGAILDVDGDVRIAAGTASLAPLKFTAGTNLTSPVAGVWEFDGTNFYASPTAVRQTVALMPRVRALASFRV